MNSDILVESVTNYAPVYLWKGISVDLTHLLWYYSVNKRASPEPPTPQMTIFYGGKVLVFNDLPADKAKEVMDLAISFEASLKKRKVETTISTPSSPGAVPVSGQNANPTLISNHNSKQNLTTAPKFVNHVVSPAVPNVSGNYPMSVRIINEVKK